MLTMNDLRSGVTIIEDGDPWIILETDFMRKAQRRPVMRTKIRNLRSGQVRERTFKQGDSIPEADVGKAKARFLYAADRRYTFMDETTYEQYTLSEDALGTAAAFLREGMLVDLLTFEGNPVVVQLPIKVGAKVISAPPGLRGDSATNIMKEVVVEGNVKVKVPLFVKEGDTIIVDTRTGEYVSRAGE
ncbi:MAG: elongation factor P [Parcubacteria group bacterium Gr01-1014_38]|nr:MAG: elongation factor P [Parcubacteria group bacterium Gr01-1014_38]